MTQFAFFACHANVLRLGRNHGRELREDNIFVFAYQVQLLAAVSTSLCLRRRKRFGRPNRRPEKIFEHHTMSFLQDPRGAEKVYPPENSVLLIR